MDWNPFECPIWDIEKPVTEEEIRGLVLARDLLAPGQRTNDCSRLDHMRRIAWFVVHGWKEDPIEVDVGIPVMGFYIGWAICDGNHRYIASILRGDRYILAACSGQVTEIKRFKAKLTRRRSKVSPEHEPHE